MGSESPDVRLESAANLLFASLEHPNSAHRAAYAYQAAQVYRGILDEGSGNQMVHAMEQAAHSLAGAASVEIRRSELAGLTTIEELLDYSAHLSRELMEQRYDATLNLLEMLSLLEQDQTPELRLAAKKSIDKVIELSSALIPLSDKDELGRIAEDVAYFSLVKKLL